MATGKNRRHFSPLVKLCLIAGVALAAVGSRPAFADGPDLLSRETVKVTADVRLVGVDGETSWLDGGFGKGRFGGGSDGAYRLRPQIVEGSLVWQPRFTWALSGTVVGVAQQGQQHPVDLSEAFLTYRSKNSEGGRLSARVGLFWPPISLEHSGPEWRVTETITPSAINAWIGEEVKVIGAEGSAAVPIGGHSFTATAAAFEFNNTAGALLAFRGWGAHDEKAVAFGRQPLPPLNSFMRDAQPEYTHPVIEIDKRVGYYLKIAWAPPIPLRIEVLHYDNRGDPEAVNDSLEWGWRTRFNDIGIVGKLGAHTELRAQALAGRTEMGFAMPDTRWVDTRFHSTYLLATRFIGTGSVSGRIEAFGTSNRGSAVTSDDDEQGWAATVAARKQIGSHAEMLAEIQRVSSRREARARLGLDARQTQLSTQLAFRVHL